MLAVDRVLDVKEQKPVLFPLSDPSQFEKLFRDGGFSEVNVRFVIVVVNLKARACDEKFLSLPEPEMDHHYCKLGIHC